MFYLVSYDLNAPGKDYSRLINAIQSYKAYCKVLKSQWIIWHNGDVKSVYNHLINFIDKTDRLLICEFNANYMGYLEPEIVNWLQKNL